jgi:cysteine desulfuration protein SufE
LGKSLPVLSEEFKTEENRIHGCQSRVWLNAYKKTIRLFLKPTAMPLLPKELLAY